MTDQEILRDALSRHPECKYGEVKNGLTPFFQLTRVVNLWKDERGKLDGYMPLYVIEGYPG